MIFIVALLTLVFSQYSSVQLLRPYFRPSDGCSLPCQLGLKVEETTGLETKRLLASHPWVLANQSSPGYSYAPDEYAQVLMTTWDWQWSGQQPDWLVDRLSVHLGWKSTGTDAIRDLRIHTTLTIGDTWLILGLPEAGTILPYFVPTGTKWDSVCANALYEAFYNRGQLRVMAFVNRPWSLISFFQTPVDLEFSSNVAPAVVLPVDTGHCFIMWP